MKATEAEKALARDISQFLYDPLGFVYYAYPWGMEKTPLAQQDGPDKWQRDVLEAIGARDITKTFRLAVASGHGVGKTALVSWLNHWFVALHPHPQSVTTANTMNQLIGKTWRELAFWSNMSVIEHWFDWTATRFTHADPQHRKTWYAQAVPWSANNTEAFAGLHARDVMVIFDEASAIDDVIWEVTEGAMTTPGAIWLAFGNPTRNTGRFRHCFPGGDFAHRWQSFKVDSRTAKMANKAQLDEWVEDYGEDSDFVRVRVRGEFPRASSAQFISSELVTECMKRQIEGYEHEPIVVGVDVARFGDDQTVIPVRQGLKVLGMHKFRGKDNVEVARLAVGIRDEYDADAIFVDGVGLGAGVVDVLRDMNIPNVFDVVVSEKAQDFEKYSNKRAELWGRMRDWLMRGASLPDDKELRAHLTGLEYGYNTKMQIQLEKKTDMKKRGLESPDCADALALTFAETIERRTDSAKYSELQKMRRAAGSSNWRIL